jgi:hypothetical protein
MILSDLKIVGKEVCRDCKGKPVLVIDYSEPPPTVELSDGRKIVGDNWYDIVEGLTNDSQVRKMD